MKTIQQTKTNIQNWLIRIYHRIANTKNIVRVDVAEGGTITSGMVAMFSDKTKYLYLGNGFYLQLTDDKFTAKYRFRNTLYTYVVPSTNGGK